MSVLLTPSLELPVAEAPAVSAPAFRHPAVVCNPLGGRCRRDPELRRRLSHLTGRGYAEASDPEAVRNALDASITTACDVLVVVGGDGTLGMVVTELLQRRQPLPPLLVIPAGTTNATALDLGVSGDAEAGLHHLEALLGTQGRTFATKLRHCRRPVMEVTHADAPPRCGFLFGLGAIAAAVERFRHDGNRLGLTGEMASFGAFLSAMSALVAGRHRGLLAPVSIETRVDDEREMKGDYLLMLASSLDRTLMGLRPYWGQEPKPLHYTAVATRSRYLRRLLPSILRGRSDARLRPENGYYSANVDRLEFYLDGTYMLDGEIHPVRRADGPLCVTALPPIEFIVPE
ncbi:MAG TPA: diacylglycerol kinase family protein [Nevskiaceae bacterium]|nr:diacylglycerol kinase family protein [Nevskiaceae bacterium]